MEFQNKIELSHKVSRDLLKEVPVAIKSRFLQRLLKPSVEKTRNFFKEFRSKPNEVSITDFGTGHYFEIIKAALEKYDNSHFDVCIDVGCGNSSLNSGVLNKWKQYIGIDLYLESTRIENKNQRFVEHDLSSGLPSISDASNYLIIAVNSFCYIGNINTLCDSIKSLPGNKTVIILDPNPSLLWESAFNGFSIFLRSYSDIISAFNCQDAKIQLTPVTLGLPMMRNWVACNLITIKLTK